MLNWSWNNCVILHWKLKLKYYPLVKAPFKAQTTGQLHPKGCVTSALIHNSEADDTTSITKKDSHSLQQKAKKKTIFFNTK